MTSLVKTRGHLDWFVVFQGRKKDFNATLLHKIFTHPDWSHVWAFAWCPDTGIYLTVDPVGNNLVIDAVPAFDHPNNVLREVYGRPETKAVVLFKKKEWIPHKFHYHGFHTCVTLIKDLLGVCSPTTQTPRGLYDYLIRNGGISYYTRKGSYNVSHGESTETRYSRDGSTAEANSGTGQEIVRSGSSATGTGRRETTGKDGSRRYRRGWEYLTFWY